MFKHILIPLDGSKLAEAILPVARTLARAMAARVTLLHILEQTPPPTIHGEPHLADAAAAEAYLLGIRENLAATGIRAEMEVVHAEPGGVAQTILRRASEDGIDLIALCAHGQAGLRGLLFGHIAQQVLQAGTIPVLLLRQAEAGPVVQKQILRILVPVDGRPLYEPAIYAAQDLAQATGAMLNLMIVVPTLNTLSPERSATGTLLPASTRAILDLAEKGAVQYLSAWLKRLKDKGVAASGEVARGEVVPGILQAAARGPADLIVMATHGRAGLDAFWKGSVTPKVIEQTHTPTLMLRVEGDEPPR